MLDLVNYVLSGFMILVFLTWMFLLKTMIKDHAATPRLEREGSTDGPMVSVILPARNEEKYIEKCLESLAAQDYKNLEIIAIDDSSTDETGNIIEKMSKKHKNIIHVKADGALQLSHQVSSCSYELAPWRVRAVNAQYLHP